MAFRGLQFRSSAEEKASLRSQVEALTRECHQLTATCEDLRSESAEHAERVKHLEAEKASAEQSVATAEAAKADAAALRSELEALHQRTKELESMLESEKMQLSAVKKSHAEEKQKMASDGKQGVNELAAAQTALKDAESRVTESRAEVSRCVHEAAASSKAMEEAKTAKIVAEAAVVEMRHKLEELRAELQAGRARANRCSDAELEVAKLKDEIAAAAEQQCKTNLERTNAQQGEQEAKDRADALQVRLEALQRDAAIAEAAAHTAGVAEASARVEAAEASMHDAMAQASTLEARASRAEVRIAELESDLNSRLTVDEARELNQRLLKAEREVAAEVEKAAAVQSEAENKIVAAELAAQAEANRRVEETVAQSAMLRSQRDALQQELAKAFDEVSAASAGADLAKASAMDRIQALEAEVLRLQGELSAKRMEVEAQKLAHYDNGREVQHLQDKLQDAIGEVERLQLCIALSGPEAAMRELSEPPMTRASTPNGSCRMRRGISSIVPPLPDSGSLMSAARRSSPAANRSSQDSSRDSSAAGCPPQPPSKACPARARKSPRELTGGPGPALKSPRELMQPRRPPGVAPAKTRHATPSTAAPSDTEDVC